MARGASEFWQALERRLPGETREREREIAREVLVLLRQRMRPEEAQHIKAELPRELKALWSTRGVGVAEEHTSRPIAELDHNQFVDRVRELARLGDMAAAAQATAAVFGAVREVISETGAEHVEAQLPSGLKALWRGDHGVERPHHAQGASPFWELLADRLAGQVPASTTEVACTVLAHLRGRLSPELAGRIRGVVPADVRDYWVAPEAGTEAVEEPERFYGRIAQELGMGDLAAARHAATAAMSALRRILPAELGSQVEDELPEELRGLWEGM